MQRINRFDFIAEHFDANRKFVINRNDLDSVAFDAKVAARKIDVVSLVLHRNEFANQIVAINFVALLNRNALLKVFLWRTEAIYARDC